MDFRRIGRKIIIDGSCRILVFRVLVLRCGLCFFFAHEGCATYTSDYRL